MLLVIWFPGLPGLRASNFPSLPVAFSNSRSLPVKRECDCQFPFPFPGAKKPFQLTPALEEKYNVNIVSADNVDCPGKLNFPRKVSQSIFLDWKSGPSFDCFVRVKVNPVYRMQGFLSYPQGRWGIQGENQKQQLLLNVVEWNIHTAAVSRTTGPNLFRLIQLWFSLRLLLNSSKWIRIWGIRLWGQVVWLVASTWMLLASKWRKKMVWKISSGQAKSDSRWNLQEALFLRFCLGLMPLRRKTTRGGEMLKKFSQWKGTSSDLL